MKIIVTQYNSHYIKTMIIIEFQAACMPHAVADPEGFLGFHGTPPPPPLEKLSTKLLKIKLMIETYFLY